MPALGSYAAKAEFDHLRSTGEPLPYDFHPDAQATQTNQALVSLSHPSWGSGERGGGGGGILPKFKDAEHKSAIAKWKAQDPNRARQRFLMCVSVRCFASSFSLANLHLSACPIVVRQTSSKLLTNFVWLDGVLLAATSICVCVDIFILVCNRDRARLGAELSLPIFSSFRKHKWVSVFVFVCIELCFMVYELNTVLIVPEFNPEGESTHICKVTAGF